MPGFDAIIDQERPIRLLTSFLTHGTIPHALLFTGIEGVGKRTAAIAFAMACNCIGGLPGGRTGEGMHGTAAQSCGECSACRKIATDRHPDVLKVVPAGLQIRIDQVRDLCQSLTMRPYEARIRIALIADAHRMNPAAGNALLKMLEEPPERTVLILTAPQTADLLPTIVSRCRHIRFKPIARNHLAAILARAYGFPAEEAALTAAMASGSVTRALAMQRRHWVQRRNWFMSELAALAHRPVTSLLALAEKLAQAKEDIPDYLELLASWVRDMVVARYDPDRIIHQDLRAEIVTAGRGVPEGFFTRATTGLAETQRRFQSNANPRLSLERLLITMAEHMRPAA
ncbi:MAG: DNA polymerase III subunit delta' [Hyphomicrobiales bacterium]